MEHDYVEKKRFERITRGSARSILAEMTSSRVHYGFRILGESRAHDNRETPGARRRGAAQLWPVPRIHYQLLYPTCVPLLILGTVFHV